jgi:eukaryotic-like serine/threonine-protein kinase
MGDATGALADLRRAITIYEGLPPRLHDEALLEACCHAMMSGAAGLAGSGMTASDGVLEAERAMDIVREIVTAGYRAPALRGEPALDPLRSRPDFQILIMDAAIPGDVFAP